MLISRPTTYKCCQFGELAKNNYDIICTIHNKSCPCWNVLGMCDGICLCSNGGIGYEVVEKPLPKLDAKIIIDNSFCIEKNGIQLQYNNNDFCNSHIASISLSPKLENWESDYEISEELECSKSNGVSIACDWLISRLVEIKSDLLEKVSSIDQLVDRLSDGMISNHVSMTDEEMSRMPQFAIDQYNCHIKIKYKND